MAYYNVVLDGKKGNNALRLPYLDPGHPLGLFDKGCVKGGKLFALTFGGKMEGIGEIQALLGQVNGGGNRLRTLNFYIWQSEGSDKGIKDGG
jgi:hypothetical protein